jgi:N-methylhydantoinase A/oxoprolinase/acetone carboxylase beta subunit
VGLVIATDIGGTFTDMVAFDTDSKTTVHAKSHTDPGDLTEGVIRCLRKSGLVLSIMQSNGGVMAPATARASSRSGRCSPVR